MAPVATGAQALSAVREQRPDLIVLDVMLPEFDGFRFYRADDARGRTGSVGAGLGLAIVGSLVTAHDGRGEVHTTPGEGTTFRILLPLSTPPES